MTRRQLVVLVVLLVTLAVVVGIDTAVIVLADPGPGGLHLDCNDQAYAMNNPDKCPSGSYLLGGGAPRGGGLLGGIGRVLHRVTGGLI